jgi:hypothetical protein
MDVFTDHDVERFVATLFRLHCWLGPRREPLRATYGGRHFGIDDRKIGYRGESPSRLERQASALLSAVAYHERLEAAKDLYWQRRRRTACGGRRRPPRAGGCLSTAARSPGDDVTAAAGRKKTGEP